MLSKQKRIVQFVDGQLQSTEDWIATERPVTIYLNQKEFATIVCSPQYIEDMVIGFLASEGVIPSIASVQSINYDEQQGVVRLTTDKAYPFYEQMLNKRYITSCCGMSRQSFIFAHDAIRAKKMHDHTFTLKPHTCFRLMQQLEQCAELFQQTGGVHNAALCSEEAIIVQRTDIGRHNALDKIYGHCLRHAIPVDHKIIAFSGRISSEIVLKVAKIGCSIILSKSAPTDLAIQLAEELGITTVGFIRGNRFNIYSHAHRVISHD